MNFRVIEKTNKETGEFIGYTLEYGSLWAAWMTVGHLYKTMKEVEHDICMILQEKGQVKVRKEYI